MYFERRHVLGNLLRDEYEDLFEGPIFCDIVDRMNGMDGFLLCRMCEAASQVARERRPIASRTASGCFSGCRWPLGMARPRSSQLAHLAHCGSNSSDSGQKFVVAKSF
ncbi:hypothetical protein [Bradyrhizobium jicamae]|uniref:hypothetical protein n=1 Tax=Bradyrhizobium jicamae TaxID=280332 RepID=UPI001FDA103E|nr:hypothetical protein [Bradyrhizobium jicamae]